MYKTKSLQCQDQVKETVCCQKTSWQWSSEIIPGQAPNKGDTPILSVALMQEFTIPPSCSAGCREAAVLVICTALPCVLYCIRTTLFVTP